MLPPSVDVVVDKTGPPSVLAGGRFEYTIDVQNDGLSTAFDVVVTDALPMGSPGRGHHDERQLQIAGQTVRCDLSFVYERQYQSDNGPVVIAGTVAPDAPASATNTATATTTEPDGNPANNTDAVTTAVRHEANVTITKAADEAEFVAGGGTGFTITVTNAGPSAATDAVVTDVLPPDGDRTPRGPAIRGARRTVLPDRLEVGCALGTIQPGQTVVLRIAGQLDPSYTGTSVVDTATITLQCRRPRPQRRRRRARGAGRRVGRPDGHEDGGQRDGDRRRRRGVQRDHQQRGPVHGARRSTSSTRCRPARRWCRS